MAEIFRATVSGSSPVDFATLDDSRVYVDTWEAKEATRTATLNPLGARTKATVVGSNQREFALGGRYEITSGTQNGLDPFAAWKRFRREGRRLTLTGTALIEATTDEWIVKEVTVRADTIADIIGGRPTFQRWLLRMETAD